MSAWEPKNGEEILVSISNTGQKFKRIFIGMSEAGHFVCEAPIDVIPQFKDWEYAKPIPDPTELTAPCFKCGGKVGWLDGEIHCPECDYLIKYDRAISREEIAAWWNGEDV